MAINSIYTPAGTVEYVSNGNEYRNMLKAKAYVAKARAKASTTVYQWPIGKRTPTKRTTRTICVVRGAIVDGVHVGNVYMKEADL